VSVAFAAYSEGVSRMMMRRTFLCGAALALAGLTAAAEEKKGDKAALAGTWAKKEGELKIEFADKGVVKIVPHGDPTVIAIVCDYTADKDGTVKVKVTGFEGKDEAKKKVQEVVPVGTKFGFKWKADGGAAKLSDVTGDNVEAIKSHLEGDFEKK
jgi:hypothetical protein